jgi:predicted RNA-binding Zn-ribbon protein involved in translation (DUF1610 family)
MGRMNESPRFGWQDDSAAEPQPWADWPRCPRCGARRDTACPDCAVPGTDFALAELDPAADLMPLPHDKGEPAAGCRSGHDACCSGGTAASRCVDHGEGSDDESLPDSDSSAVAIGAPVVMFVCPTCDEAFTPRFFRRCRQCGHDFGSGPDIEPADEPANYRVVFAMLAVIAAMAGIWIYLVLLFRQ